jgi:hypothetical protein
MTNVVNNDWPVQARLPADDSLTPAARNSAITPSLALIL